MNIGTAIAPAISPSHLTAYAEVDAWRGRCVRHYAKLEQAIARFLAEHYVEVPVGGYGLGCRLKQLVAFIDKAPTKNTALQKAVKALEAAKARREAIVHGDGTIYISKDGNWLWDCAFLDAKDPAARNAIFREEEANSFQRRLKAQVQSLCDRLNKYEVG